MKQRILLYDFLEVAFSEVASVGANQFMYWDPRDPQAWVSPDSFVCFGTRYETFDSWKVWELGIPQVAVELVDAISDEPGWVVESPEPSWEQKIAGYRHIGVRELIRFEPDCAEQPLRAWDLVDGDLIERDLKTACAHSDQLGGFWVVLPDPRMELILRLSHDELGEKLFPTRTEVANAAYEAAQQRRREIELRLAQLTRNATAR